MENLKDLTIEKIRKSIDNKDRIKIDEYESIIGYAVLVNGFEIRIERRDSYGREERWQEFKEKKKLSDVYRNEINKFLHTSHEGPSFKVEYICGILDEVQEKYNIKV